MRVDETTGLTGGPTFAEATRLLRAAALARAIDEPRRGDRLAPLLSGRLALQPYTIEKAIDAVVREAAHDLLTHGWRVAEIHAFAAKRLDPVALAYLVDALATTVQWTVAPPWLAELRTLDARVWWSSSAPQIRQWAERHQQGRAATLRVVVDVLALLAYVPRTGRPLPGMPGQLRGDHTVEDGRVAARIDALLARATRTDYPDEAAACAAKAQDLLLRHAAAPTVTRRVVADPRRLAATVGVEVTGLLQRAAAVFGVRRRRPLPYRLALTAGSAADRP